MSFTEVTHESWFSRIGNSLKGILFGLLIAAAAAVLLFWNEGRAVHRARTLAEGQGRVRANVPIDRVNPELEAELVHMLGKATPEGLLTDEAFGVSLPNSLKLRRRVEMYQWIEREERETRKKTGGGTETVTSYSYSREWSEQPIDSSQFQSQGQSEYGQGNPPMPFRTTTMTASEIRLGAFRLSEGLVRQISTWVDIALIDSDLEHLPPELRERIQLSEGRFYLGDDPQNPQVGDVRIQFSQVEPQEISLIAQQVGSSFRPYQATSAKGSIELLSIGQLSADEMFATAVQQNRTLTWIVRFAGFAIMGFGFNLVLRPFTVLADVLPFLGNLVGFGTTLVAFAAAAAVSFLTIAIAWLFYRPLLAVALVALAIGITAAIIYFIRRSSDNASRPSQGFPLNA